MAVTPTTAGQQEQIHIWRKIAGLFSPLPLLPLFSFCLLSFHPLSLPLALPPSASSFPEPTSVCVFAHTCARVEVVCVFLTRCSRSRTHTHRYRLRDRTRVRPVVPEKIGGNRRQTQNAGMQDYVRGMQQQRGLRDPPAGGRGAPGSVRKGLGILWIRVCVREIYTYIERVCMCVCGCGYMYV